MNINATTPSFISHAKPMTPTTGVVGAHAQPQQDAPSTVGSTKAPTQTPASDNTQNNTTPPRSAYEARHPAAVQSSESLRNSSQKENGDTKETAAQSSTGRSEAVTKDSELTQKEQKELQDLKARDAEVRAHEAAHKAAAGQYATGAASFSYQRGPDGQQYAVGGEVGIDTSPISGDPEATLQKANTIRAAATAPANPSSQDRAVAAEASVMAAEARAEIAKEAMSTASDSTSPTETKAPLNDGAPTNTTEQNPISSGQQATQQYQAIGEMGATTQHNSTLDMHA